MDFFYFLLSFGEKHDTNDDLRLYLAEYGLVTCHLSLMSCQVVLRLSQKKSFEDLLQASLHIFHSVSSNAVRSNVVNSVQLQQQCSADWHQSVTRGSGIHLERFVSQSLIHMCSYQRHRENKLADTSGWKAPESSLGFPVKNPDHLQTDPENWSTTRHEVRILTSHSLYQWRVWLLQLALCVSLPS